MSPDSKFQKSSGTLTPSVLKLFTVFTKAGEALRANHAARTPSVISRQRNNAVPRWIMMNVIQPRQIRALECNMALPKLKPYFPSRSLVPEIKLSGRLHVKLAEKFPQIARVGRRRGNEVIMIGQHRPSAQVPAELVRASEQGLQKEIQPQRRTQMRQFLISTRSDDIKAGLKQPVRRPVRQFIAKVIG